MSALEPLKLARTPTPLELLERTSERLGVEIWVKRDDLTRNSFVFKFSTNFGPQPFVIELNILTN